MDGDGQGAPGPRDRRPLIGLAVAVAALVFLPVAKMWEQSEPRAITEGPEPFLTAAQEIDAFWRREFAAQYPMAREAYRTPRVVFAEDAQRLSGVIGDYAGYYVEGSETIRIVLDEPAHFVFFVIAHEFGHHAQALAGLSDARDQALRGGRSGDSERRVTLRYELQAECLAGVWAFEAVRDGRLLTRDEVDHWRAALLFGGDSLTHGRAEQRARWFDVGYLGGAAARCDTFSPPWEDL